jgi:hypothetical protein
MHLFYQHILSQLLCVVLRLEREKDTDLALQKLFNGDKRQKYE